MANTTYALTVDYETSGIPPGSGIAWLVTDARTGAVLAKTPNLSSEHRGEQGDAVTTCFTTPREPAFVNLSLLYQRQPGTVRVEGKLALKEVRLATASNGACAGEKISNSRAASPAS